MKHRTADIIKSGTKQFIL